MSLFGYAKKDWVRKHFLFYDTQHYNATDDRRRIKDNADKLGGAITDLECRVNALEVNRKHGRSKKK